MSHAFQRLDHPAILQIIPSLDTGGAERTTVDMARAIIAAGGRALVASSGGHLVDELRKMGAQHIEMPVQSKNPLVMARNVKLLTQLIEREKIDLVHARSRAPAWSALAAARRTGKPFVTTYHSKVHERPALKVFYNSVMARGDAVIANSSYTAERIRLVHAPKEARLFTVPRGLDMDEFSPDAVTPERLERLRKDWAIPQSHPPIFLLPARLTRWKGQMLTLQAAARLHAAGRSDFLLLLVGDAQGREDYRRELEDAARKAGISHLLRITGHCADMQAAYALSDIVLAPSLEPEPFGRTAVEAQAMARPVIVSDAGGQRETVLTEGENIRTGLSIPTGDVEALAEAMRTALDLGPENRASMGKSGREHVLARYALKTMTDAALDIYASLIAASHAGR